ncbi:MAG: anti-sigma 24 factor, partial [Betaproteobacteria bacterium]|nr:anti-sigma 24 factor [Betaproteobacteria bacterium]
LLIDEPTVLAPPPRRSGRSVQRAGWLAMSLAAGAAAIALVVWMALPQGGTQQPPIAAAGPASAPQPQPAPVATEVEDYLLAHQRFSPSGAMQGVASYVRTVADEARR